MVSALLGKPLSLKANKAADACGRTGFEAAAIPGIQKKPLPSNLALLWVIMSVLSELFLSSQECDRCAANRTKSTLSCETF